MIAGAILLSTPVFTLFITRYEFLMPKARDVFRLRLVAHFLGPEDLDEFSPDITNGTNRKICAAFQTANLMTTWGHDTINGSIVANNALLKKIKGKE